jgi:hypothetical protein
MIDKGSLSNTFTVTHEIDPLATNGHAKDHALSNDRPSGTSSRDMQSIESTFYTSEVLKGATDAALTTTYEATYEATYEPTLGEYYSDDSTSEDNLKEVFTPSDIVKNEMDASVATRELLNESSVSLGEDNLIDMFTQRAILKSSMDTSVGTSELLNDEILDGSLPFTYGYTQSVKSVDITIERIITYAASQEMKSSVHGGLDASLPYGGDVTYDPLVDSSRYSCKLLFYFCLSLCFVFKI